MQRLPPAVRSSLVAEASISAQSAIRRWSLRSLAFLNSDANSHDSLLQVTEVPRSENSCRKPQRLGASSKKRGCVRNDAAEILLNDVRLRLAGQHDRVARLIEGSKNLMDAPYSTGDGINDGGVVASVGYSGVAKKGVVKAINNPVGRDMKRWMKDLREAELIQKGAIRQLENLEVCHVDTYYLLHQLFPPQLSTGDHSRPEYLARWSAADRAMMEAAFEQVRSRHAPSVETLAEVVIGLRRCRSLRNGDGNGVLPPGYFCGIDLALIDAFLWERLGVQLLCDHYVALDKGKSNGGISVGCDLWDVVDDAVTEARHLCDANLGIAPDVRVALGLADCPPFDTENVLLGDIMFDSVCKDDIKISLIRPWIHHALVEVLKNAMGSSVKRTLRDHTGNGIIQPPDVHVRIVESERYLTVIVLDEGTGLDDDSKVRAFRFGDSSSPRRWDRLDEQQTYAMVRPPLGSLGVGLPLSRIMMRLFGGDLVLSDRFPNDKKIQSPHHGATGCVVALKLPKNDESVEGTSLPNYSPEPRCQHL